MSASGSSPKDDAQPSQNFFPTRVRPFPNRAAAPRRPIFVFNAPDSFRYLPEDGFDEESAGPALLSRRHPQDTLRAEGHVAHTVVDQDVVARLWHDGVKDDALAGSNRVSGDAGEKVLRVPVGIDSVEHATDDVKGTVEVGSGINEIYANPLADSGGERLVLVLKGNAIKDNFVRSYSQHLIIVAGHHCSFELLGIPFPLDNHITHVRRRQRL